MIIYFDVSLLELKTCGKEFHWPRPPCPRCKSKVWGHGHETRFFNGITGAVFMKRWRCHICRLILICRPKSYWRRYQESIENIFDALKYRVTNLVWPSWVSRQRGGHWMNKLIKKAKIDLTMKDSLLGTITFFQDKSLLLN